MKDKLYKTGHKKAYYRLRRTLRLSLFAIALGVTTAAPIIVTYGVESARAEAQRAVESEESEPIGDSSESAPLSFVF